MIFKQKFVVLIFCMFIIMFAKAQKTMPWKLINPSKLNSKTVDSTINVLQNSKALENVFAKLYQLKNQSSGQQVVFTHIGDSHLQADKISSVVRTEFQNYFGNAGRGLVFPFKIAKTNGASDVVSNSTEIWQSSRLSKLNAAVNCGIAAHGIKTEQPTAEIFIELKDSLINNFDQLTLFYSKKMATILFESALFNTKIKVDSNSQFTSITLPKLTAKFKLQFTANQNNAIEFFGVSASKKNTSGILYHAIGANGAKLSDYNKAPVFWNQLPELQTDCYLLSLGTNEAQNQNLTAEAYTVELATMIENLKAASPNAAIIVLSPPVSYYKKVKPNKILGVIASAISNYCFKNNIAFYDLYAANRGVRGTLAWRKLKLLNTDLVHFTNAGYFLQGTLLTEVFANAYNNYIAEKNF